MERKNQVSSKTGKREDIAVSLDDSEKMTLEQLIIRGQENYSKTDLITIGLIMYADDLVTLRNLAETGLLYEDIRKTQLNVPGKKYLMEKFYSVTDKGRKYYNKNIKK